MHQTETSSKPILLSHNLNTYWNLNVWQTYKPLWTHANNEALKVYKHLHEIIPLRIPNCSCIAMTKLTPDADTWCELCPAPPSSPRPSPTINHPTKTLPWSPVTGQIAAGQLYVIRDLGFQGGEGKEPEAWQLWTSGPTLSLCNENQLFPQQLAGGWWKWDLKIVVDFM